MELKQYNPCISLCALLLLIELYGIETNTLDFAREAWNTFNRTIWN